MENASLTISLPRAMKESIAVRLREAHYSTPSEYIRALIRFDLERRSQVEAETVVRRGVQAKASLGSERGRSIVKRNAVRGGQDRRAPKR
jgi:Arc/MetJ-type ribon-helix-helix transcriptional regulator